MFDEIVIPRDDEKMKIFSDILSILTISNFGTRLERSSHAHGVGL